MIQTLKGSRMSDKTRYTKSQTPSYLGNQNDLKDDLTVYIEKADNFIHEAKVDVMQKIND